MFKKSRYLSLMLVVLSSLSCANLFNFTLPASGTHTVYFNTMGGSMIDAQNVNHNDKVSKPANPERTHYFFQDWYREAYFKTTWDFKNQSVVDDTLLYAKWREDFQIINKPVVQLLNYNGDSTKTYKFQEPWNYEKSYNEDREYPLVIALHGSTPSTNHYYSPVILGKNEEMMDYPCFYLAPNNSTLGWDSSASWVRDLIVDMIKTKRIDINRIYIIGFSMGGSGSYYFAERLFQEKGLITAGIVRCAGMSNSDLPNAIAEKISVWYHYGLNDSSSVLSIGEEAYTFFKNLPFNTGYSEFSFNDTLSGFARETLTLKKNGIEFMKSSRYTNMGHTDDPVWDDPDVLSWLFSQTLEQR